MSDLIESLKRTPMPFRQKVTFALLSLVILCSGFGLGVSLTFNHLKDRLRPRGPVPFVQSHLERVAKEYALTPEQKEQVKPILERFHDSFRQMWADSQKSMSSARDELVVGMKQVLTTEQYDKWFKDLQELEKKRSRRGPSSRRGDRRDRDRNGSSLRDRDPNMKPDPNRPSRWHRGDREPGNDQNGPEPLSGSATTKEAE
jgi:Spy/CpxP family protein refolding chaperone